MIRKIWFLLLWCGLVTLVSACNNRLYRDAPVPEKVYAAMQRIRAATDTLTEYVGSVIVAEIILGNAVENDGSVGKVCDTIALAKPGIETALNQHLSGEIVSEATTIMTLQIILEELSQMQNTLTCATLISEGVK